MPLCEHVYIFKCILCLYGLLALRMFGIFSLPVVPAGVCACVLEESQGFLATFPLHF